MADKGIIFSGPMVHALLDRNKTQTRRVAKPRVAFSLLSGEWTDSYVLDPGNAEWLARGMPYRAGDRLYVRESCYLPPKEITAQDMQEGADTWPRVIFAEEDRAGGRDMMDRCRWRSMPSIHMPRWASRLWLGVTDVRIERLQTISPEDAECEGIDALAAQHFGGVVQAYAALWDSLHGAGSDHGWAANPWVVAVTFTVHRGNIDARGEGEG
jgi:hypothetical protein